jgi:hypothetical protein
MNAHEEVLVETYVHRPGDLTETQRRRVQRLVADDPEAAEWARVLRATYDAFHSIEDGRVPAVVDRFVDEMFAPPSVLSLTPVSAVGPTRLAADTGTADRFESLAVLTSREHGVLVRVLKDAQQDEVRVYVLARDAEAYRHALFESADGRLQVPLRSDGYGRFSPAGEVTPQELQKGRLRRCLWSGPLVAGKTPSAVLRVEEGYTVRAEWTGAQTLALHVTTRNADRPPLRWVGIGDGAEVALTPFQRSTAHVEVPADGRGRTLRLFG